MSTSRASSSESSIVLRPAAILSLMSSVSVLIGDLQVHARGLCPHHDNVPDEGTGYPAAPSDPRLLLLHLRHASRRELSDGRALRRLDRPFLVVDETPCPARI